MRVLYGIHIIIYIYIHWTGWWLTPLKNDGVSNSWDDDIPNGKSYIRHVPNHQPVDFMGLPARHLRFLAAWVRILHELDESI